MCVCVWGKDGTYSSHFEVVAVATVGGGVPLTMSVCCQAKGHEGFSGLREGLLHTFQPEPSLETIVSMSEKLFVNCNMLMVFCFSRRKPFGDG